MIRRNSNARQQIKIGDSASKECLTKLFLGHRPFFERSRN
jgi:hypothetical protein